LQAKEFSDDMLRRIPKGKSQGQKSQTQILTLLFRMNPILNIPQILGGRITEMMKFHHKELAKVINHAYFLIDQLASKRKLLFYKFFIVSKIIS
jgi:hypothetical protein